MLDKAKTPALGLEDQGRGSGDDTKACTDESTSRRAKRKLKNVWYEDGGRYRMKARLHPRWVGGRAGYLYSAIFDGKLIVDRSRDPECDAARALVAMGHTGMLTLLDGKTGKPRTIINIEKAARLTCEETGGVPRFRKYRERGGSEGYSPEDEVTVGGEAA